MGGKRRGSDPGATTAAVVDVAALEGDTIRRTDGVYAAVIVVDGEFFGLMAEDEQDRRITHFKEWLTGLPEGWPIQITLMVEPAQIGAYVEAMQQAAARGTGTRLGRLADEQAALATELAGTALVETTTVTVTGASATEALQRADLLLKGLRGHGFAAALCGQDRLGDLLQRAYGHDPVALDAALGGLPAALARAPAAAPAPAPPAATRRRAGTPRLQVAPPPDAPAALGAWPRLRDLLAPSAWVETPGLLDLGGVYAASLVAVAYPEMGYNGWLERLLHFAHGGVRRRIAWHLHPIPSAQALAELNARLRDLDANANAALKRGLRPDVDTEHAIQDAEALRQAIATGDERLFNATLLVTLLHEDPALLREAVTALRAEAAGWALALRPTWLEEGPAFRATLPLGLPAFERRLPLSSWPVASMFPFTAGEVIDPTGGDLWGRNLATGAAVILDPRRRPPGHLAVVARTQSGKSFALKLLATQALLRGDEDVIILDPSPVVDYGRWTAALGGTYARLAAGSPDGLNPCEIRLPRHPDRADAEDARPVSAKVAFLTTLLGLMAYPRGELPPEERALLQPALRAVYTAWGFTEDSWEGALDQRALTATPRARPSPTLRDVVAAVAATPGLEGLARRVGPFLDGPFALFAGPTTVDTGQPLVVFNVHGLVDAADDATQRVAYAMIMEHVFGRLAERARRTLVVVDEAHIMFARQDTALFVARLYRMAAKLGGRVALITQGITDLLGDPETGLTVAGQEQARACLSNSSLTLLLHNDKGSDLALLQRTYRLTDAEVRVLQDAEPGQGVLLADDVRAVIEVLAPPTLYTYLTTRPEEITAFAAQGAYDDLPAWAWGGPVAAASA